MDPKHKYKPPNLELLKHNARKKGGIWKFNIVVFICNYLPPILAFGGH